MQDLVDYAAKNGIALKDKGRCQFCGSKVKGGVFECHNNVYHIAAILDYNNPQHYLSRFLSVDAMALQHCEIHGPWNNHIHLARLYLIFEKKVLWDYSKTPQLSNIINQFKKSRTETLIPPPLQQRGNITSSDLLMATDINGCMKIVYQWATEVYSSFKMHEETISKIADKYLEKYY